MKMTIVSKVKSLSLYVERQLNRHAEWALEGSWQEPYIKGQLIQQGQELITSATNLIELNKFLRLFRNQQMVRIAIRDLANLATLDETLRDTSDLADVLVQTAMDWHYKFMSERYGKPIGEESGSVQTMLILGMGKLGGRELNFSSDIDMIYIYPERGSTQGGRQKLENEQFFIRLAQAMNKSLADFTEDGIVYRVDMRLRPFGSSGPLVVTFTAMENYYALHGRAWERYALVKARIMAGCAEKGHELLDILKPFVYRKYIDFTALDSLRDLKRQISAKVKQKGMEDNLKLGPGGIREIEFIVQAFQLIHGGKILELQGKSLLPMLAEVVEQGFLEQSVGDELAIAYKFLRRAENRIQMWNDQQLHSLPTEEKSLVSLSIAMGYENVADFLTTLSQYRKTVQLHFDAVFVLEEDNSVDVNNFEQAWLIDIDLLLTADSFAEPQTIHRMIKQFKASPKVQKLPAESRKRLDKVMPLMLAEIAEIAEISDTAEAKGTNNNQSKALDRVLRVLESVLRRSVYFVLLFENHQVLQNLVKVCGLSPWMTEMLAKYPALMDQLFDESNTINPLEKQELMAEALHFNKQHEMDDEAYMNALRQWRHIQVFKVALADVTGHLPVMQVSDYLTWIAEAVLASVLRYAWLFMNQKHGLPSGIEINNLAEIPFIILGYGKMGGIELGYGSDLDMVFLYSGVDSSEKSQGNGLNKPLENSIYFLRMGQKIISLLTTMMPTGKLYEVDMRLRPNGNSGMLVTSLENYQTYIENKAWVWEHQALVRARAVAGGKQASIAFAEFRKSFLQELREEVSIKKEVVNMRQKMRDNLDKTDSNNFPDNFDLKQGTGGIVDIEFMVQYFVLSFAKAYPKLAKYSDNVRCLEAIKESGLLQFDEAEKLEKSYQAYRKRYHRLALQNSPALILQNEFIIEREFVISIWQKIMS